MSEPRDGYPPEDSPLTGTAESCPRCGSTVDVWMEGFRFDDRHTLVIEFDSFCRECVFSYHGDVPIEKVGGFLGLIAVGESDPHRVNEDEGKEP